MTTEIKMTNTRSWDDITVLTSSDENVWKFIFTKADACVEAVLYRYPTFRERTVMCMSTQCGCPMGCSFCGTGKQFVRNLTIEEMMDQYYAIEEFVAQIDGTEFIYVEKMQVMFMSMGEPLLNMKNLAEVIKGIHKENPEAQLLISTAAPSTVAGWDEFMCVAMDVPTVGLQFSVHEAFDEDRNAIIPIKKKCSIGEMAWYGNFFHRITGRRPFFNYCVHEKNSSQAHADELYIKFNPEVWECTLSVICETDETVMSSVDRQLDMIHDFSGKLVELGFNTRVFCPAGQDDIAGGCGQLWHTQRWMRDNVDKVKTLNYR